MSRVLMGGACAWALAQACGGSALAQDPDTLVREQDTIVVTGSAIRGTPEDAALPVDVLSEAELRLQGALPIQDVIKNLSASTGVLGDSNQFASAQTTGVGTVNLRGLGAARTLVLLNNRRFGVGAADTNMLPRQAIGRIEVLKDGAAAIYGSDAIGGVVNFFTKELDGFEVVGNYSYIDGSDGDYDAGLNWGWVGDRSNLLLSAGYRARSELDALDRDWATRPYTAFDPAALGGWSSIANGGPFATDLGLTNRFIDPSCGQLGDFTRGPADCNFQFSQWNNLVEDEDHYQFFGSFDHEISPSMAFHAEALWAAHYVEAENSSPSYPTVQGPGTAANGLGFLQAFGIDLPTHFTIPETNPGLTPAFVSQLPADVQAYLGADGAQNLYTLGLFWRPLGTGGNPLFGGAKEDQRNFEQWRVSGGLNGEFANGDYGYDLAVTYNRGTSDIETPDIISAYLGYALRGLGGPDCDTDPSTPGIQGTPGEGGCLYFNPFSNAIAGNPALGLTNPLYDPSVANDIELIDWFFDRYAYGVDTSQLVVDAVVDGRFGFDLPGGSPAWAVGGQYRRETAERNANDISNAEVTPCLLPGDSTCGTSTGPLAFFGALTDYDYERDNYAIFAELQLPLLDSLNAQVAARFEDYGDQGGTTFDPKLALRWQALDGLALRGSVSTTFRAPPLTSLDPSATTTLSFTSAARSYRAFDNFGNPDLQPEKAFTYNLGVIADKGPFALTVDYFSFDFEDGIQGEGGTDIVRGVFPGGPLDAGERCDDPAFAGLVGRITFDGGVCAPGNVLRTAVRTINGPELRVRGIDLSTTLDLGETFGSDAGVWSVGADATYLLKWASDDLFVEDVLIQEGRNYAGYYDHIGFDSIPELKLAAFLSFTSEPLALRATVRHQSEMEDTRDIDPDHPTAVIDSFTTLDVTGIVPVNDSVQLNFGVINLTDEDPPFAGTDLGYDPFSHNPLGRVLRAGVRLTF